MKTAKAHLESIFEKNIESEFTFDKGPIYNELTTASHTGDNFYSMHKKKPTRQERTQSSSQPMSRSSFLQMSRPQTRCLNCELINIKLEQQVKLNQELRNQQSNLMNQIYILETKNTLQLQNNNRKNNDMTVLNQKSIKNDQKYHQADSQLDSIESQKLQQRLHECLMENGELKRQGTDFKRQLLEKEQQFILLQRKLNNQLNENSVIQSLQNEIDEMKKSQRRQQKFIESFLHMVNGCQSDNSEQLNLKQAWSWLKTILEEYMTLKQQERKKL